MRYKEREYKKVGRNLLISRDWDILIPARHLKWPSVPAGGGVDGLDGIGNNKQWNDDEL